MLKKKPPKNPIQSCLKDKHLCSVCNLCKKKNTNLLASKGSERTGTILEMGGRERAQWQHIYLICHRWITCWMTRDEWIERVKKGSFYIRNFAAHIAGDTYPHKHTFQLCTYELITPSRIISGSMVQGGTDKAKGPQWDAQFFLEGFKDIKQVQAWLSVASHTN